MPLNDIDAPSDLNRILGISGWRACFLYAPLSILVGQIPGPRGLLRLFKLMLRAVVPMGALALGFAGVRGLLGRSVALKATWAQDVCAAPERL